MAISYDSQVTDVELERFNHLIYQRTGIRISSQKKALLSNRLRRRLRALQLSSYSEYWKFLQSLPSSHDEWDSFLQEITTHETYLFRDRAQWEWFSGTFLKEIQREAREAKRKKTLRIWSAASSTGDEAMTIACCIADKLLGNDQWDVEIAGTDIGIDAIRTAQKAVFNTRAMANVSQSMRKRFFSELPNGTFQAQPAITGWSNFRQHNLLDPFRRLEFDVVFLKNVLIYFDNASKQKVMNHVFAALKPGGYLVTGPAEGVSEFLKSYTRMTPWLHRKN